jgi:DKNYY family
MKHGPSRKAFGNNSAASAAAGLILVLVAGACSLFSSFEGLKDNFGGYTVSDGKVIYHSGLYGMGSKDSWEIPGADADTFSAAGEGYAKDKNSAYLDGRIIPQSDGPSFKLLEKPYAADWAHVYYGAQVLSNSPQTFKIIAKLEKITFSTDGKKVFSGSVEFLPGTADAASFERIGPSGYFRDRNRVYTFEKVVEGADPRSFEVLPDYEERYARDEKNVFYRGTKVQGCDPKTHEVIDLLFHRDDKSVFYMDKKITANDGSFTKLAVSYSRDKSSAYWQAEKISEDGQNFIAFSSDDYCAYAKDGRNAFRCDHKLKDVDASSFVGLSARYAKDKHKVYFSVSCEEELSVVDGADPESFELSSGDGVDAIDKNNRYNFGTNRGPRN